MFRECERAFGSVRKIGAFFMLDHSFGPTLEACRDFDEFSK